MRLFGRDGGAATWTILCSLVAALAKAKDLTSFGKGDDLQTFVSRPDLRPPKYVIKHKTDEAHSNAGYWFVDPYESIVQEPATKKLELCQTGPHIYDSNGELIWSGACQFGNRNAHDFKMIENGSNTNYMSVIMGSLDPSKRDPSGAGVTMDRSFNVQKTLSPATSDETFNMHEFTVLENGDKALHIISNPIYADVSSLSSNRTKDWIFDGGFQERNLATGEVLFEWSCLKSGVVFSESDKELHGQPTAEEPWDWFHPNSVDKTTSGDYILSARFTSTIYKINGTDGSIIWRLGGPLSNFQQVEGLNLMYQHDAKLHSDGDGHTILSVFDNACAEYGPTDRVSTAYLLDLDEENMTAKIIHAHKNPDGDVTRFRGNAQYLRNGHMFVGWSKRGHISEFDTSGNLVLDAQYAGTRFGNYRAYKLSNFTGISHESIALKCDPYGLGERSAVSVCYVSWNGATEVKRWRLLAVDEDSSSNANTTLGNIARTGFETQCTAIGYHENVIAEALDGADRVIGRSDVQTVSRPVAWDHTELVSNQVSAAINLDEGPAFDVIAHVSARSGSSLILAFCAGTILGYCLILLTKGTRRYSALNRATTVWSERPKANIV